MRKLAEVEEAKVLMTEAKNWSVMRWLREKKRVRKTADRANEALWAMQKELKLAWNEDLKTAYAELTPKDGNGAPGRDANSAKGTARNIQPDVKALALAVKQADDEAYRAHMEAEDTFDKAERILSTSLAREGSQLAILSWVLYEKAITKAEEGVRSTSAAK